MHIYMVYEKYEDADPELVGISQTLEAAHDYAKGIGDSLDELVYLVQLCDMPMDEVFTLLSYALHVAPLPAGELSQNNYLVLDRWIVEKDGKLVACK